MQILHGPKKAVRRLAFAPDGTALVAGGYDQYLWRWELPSGTATRLPSLGGTPKFLLWAADGSVAVGVGSVVVLRPPDGDGCLFGEMPDWFAGVGGGCLSADGKTLLVFMQDAIQHDLIRRWNLRTQKELPPWPVGLPGFIAAWPELLAASPDGKVIACTHAKNGEVKNDTFHVSIRSARTGKQLSRLPASNESAEAIAFSPDGTRLVLAHSQSVWLWEWPGGRVIATHKSKKSVTGLAYSPDGRVFATTGNDGLVRLWDGRTGEPRGTFDWQLDKALCVAFTADGLRAGAGGSSGKVVVWDVE